MVVSPPNKLESLQRRGFQFDQLGVLLAEAFETTRLLFSTFLDHLGHLNYEKSSQTKPYAPLSIAAYKDFVDNLAEGSQTAQANVVEVYLKEHGVRPAE